MDPADVDVYAKNLPFRVMAGKLTPSNATVECDREPALVALRGIRLAIEASR